MQEELAHYLVEEIAMDGEAGVSVARLAQFIKTYHEERDVEGLPGQKVDDAFVDYTWRHLLESRPDLRLGVLEVTAPPPAPAEAVAEEPTPVKQNGRKGKPPKGQRDFSGSGRLNEVAGRFVDTDAEERTLTRAEVSERHGSDLRIAASPDAIWLALTGSHNKTGRLTNFVLAVLETVAHAREKGITMVELGHEFVHDQKSLFHFVKVLVELNIVVKFRSSYFDKKRHATYNTNRILHRRFLERSEAWRISAEATAAAAEAAGEQDDIDTEMVFQPADTDAAQWRPLTLAHFFSTEQVVINRVKVVLRQAPNNTLAHVDLLPAINLVGADVVMRKKLNRLIERLCQQGVTEKVTVAAPTKSGAEGRLHCVRLIDVEADIAASGANLEVDLDNTVQTTETVAHETIDWQLISLLDQAGDKGLNLAEIGKALSIVDARGIESLLARAERASITRPAHLADIGVRSVIETVGRVKQSRFFTLAGYAARCRRDGIEHLGEKSAIENPELVGGFAPTSYFQFYTDVADFDNRIVDQSGVLKLRNTGNAKLGRPKKNATAAAVTASASPAPSPSGPPASQAAATKAKTPKEPKQPKAPKEPKAPKPPKPAKAPQAPRPPQPSDSTPGTEASPSEPPPPPKVPKKLGRPKKQPGDPKSPYVRKKDADGFYINRPPGSKMTTEEYREYQIEQRAKQEAKEARKAAKRARAELEEDEIDEEDVGPIDSEAKRPRKRRRTAASKKKRIIASETPEAEDVTVDDYLEDAEQGEEAEDDANLIPPPLRQPFSQPAPPIEPLLELPDPPELTSGVSDAALPDLELRDAVPSADDMALDPALTVPVDELQPTSDAALPAQQPEESLSIAESAPSSVVQPTPVVVPKKRGRPRKYPLPEPVVVIDQLPVASTSAVPITSISAAPVVGTSSATVEPPAKKRRGRPSKKTIEAATAAAALAAQSEQAVRVSDVDDAPNTMDIDAPASPLPPLASTEVQPLATAMPPPMPPPTMPDAASPMAVPPPAMAPPPAAAPSSPAAQLDSPPADAPVASASGVRAPPAALAEMGVVEVQQTLPPEPAPAAEETEKPQKGAPRARRRTGHKVVRLSHSQEVREAEVVGLLTEKGGIALNTQGFRIDHQAYVKRLKPNASSGSVIDRLTIMRVLKTASERGLIRETTIRLAGFAGSTTEYDILHLASIEIDSEPMRRFIAQLQEASGIAPNAGRWGNKRRQLDGVQVERRKTGPPKPTSVPVGPLPEVDDDEVIHDFFAGQWRIVVQHYGLIYGRLARAGRLHQCMVDLCMRNTGSVAGLLSNDDLFTELTLGNYLEVVSLTNIEPTLDDFLKTTGARDTILRDLPDDVRRDMLVGKARSREKLGLLLGILTTLRIVLPVSLNIDGEEKAASVADASYWRLREAMPVYHFASKDMRKPLISVVKAVDSASRARYWQELRRACSPRVKPPPIEAPEGIEAVIVPSRTFSRDLTAKTKWTETPVLLGDQKDWLAKQAPDPQAALIDSALLDRLSRVVLVPKSTVVEYLTTLLPEPATEPAASTSTTVVRSRIPAPMEGKKRTSWQAQQSLAARAAEAESQRERDWETIVRRYEQRAHGRTLDAQVAVTLKTWFLLPGGGRMSVKQLEEQLERYLSFGAGAPPPALPELPRAPQGFSLAKAKRQGHRQGEAGSSRPPVPRPQGLQDSGYVIEDEPMHPGLQRHRWTAKSDELFRDAYAIANGRANYLDGTLSWESIGAVFPHRAINQIRQHGRVMFARPAETAYVRALEQAWVDVWVRDVTSGDLVDRYPNSLSDFDMVAHVTHLRREIDKTALRAADFFTVNEDELDLPDATYAIESRWTVRHSGPISKELNSNLHAYWFGAGGNTKERMSGVAQFSFACPCEPSLKIEPEPLTRQANTSLGICGVKMLIHNHGEEAAEDLANKVLANVDAEEATHVLLNAGMVRRSNDGGFVKFDMAEKFKNHLESGMMVSVGKLEKTLSKDDGTADWPLVIDDGQMIALCSLFAHNKIELDIDMTGIKDSLEELGFNSRKGDDETIETALMVEAKEPMSYKRAYLKGPTSLLDVVATKTKGDHGVTAQGTRAACHVYLASNDKGRYRATDCTGCINESMRALKATHSVMDGALLDVIYRIAADSPHALGGVEPHELRTGFSRIGHGDFEHLAMALIEASPPLLVWVGTSRPTLVAAQMLGAWTVDVPTVDGPTLRVLPRMWTGLDGTSSKKPWAVAARAVLKQVMDSPNISEMNLFGKLTPALELVEVHQAVEHLVHNGSIVRTIVADATPSLLNFWQESRLLLSPDFIF